MPLGSSGSPADLRRDQYRVDDAGDRDAEQGIQAHDPPDGTVAGRVERQIGRGDRDEDVRLDREVAEVADDSGRGRRYVGRL